MKPNSTGMIFTAWYLPIALLAYLLQTKLLFSSDVAYLIHTAFIQLAGGKYGVDIFETNPPMILYLYYPVCFLSKWTGMNIMSSLRLYILFLAFVSSGLCWYLLNKILLPAEKFHRYFLLFVLWIIFLFVPVFEIGQREHLLVLFMLPYLFTVTAKLENKPIPILFAIFVGFIAGLGFALKPFFLIPLCFVELFVIWKKRQLFAWLRIETVTLCCVLLLYSISILIFEPGYLHTIAPLLHYYFAVANEPWDFILTRPLIIFCFVVIFSYGLFYPYDRYRTFNTVIWLATVGMTIAFLITQTSWYYHILPALSLGYLLLANYVCQIMPEWGNVKFNLRVAAQYCAILLLLLCVIYSVPFYNTIDSTNRVITSEWFVSNKQLIDFLNSRPGKQSVYCFSNSGTVDCFPLVYLTHSDFGGRFPFFWWTAVFQQNPALLQPKKDKQFLVDAVAADLNHFQPAWICLNKKLQEQKVLTAMMLNKNFRHAWQRYHFQTEIGRYKIYRRESS